jgi:hypothetical protein
MKTKLITGLVLAIGMVLVMPAIGQSPAISRSPNAISWSGRVDETVLIHFRGGHVWTNTVTGKDPSRINFEVNEPLPADPIHVWLDQVNGRGRVQLMQEPREDNDYTAVVRVHDWQRGASYYTFVLRWDEGASPLNDNGTPRYHYRDYDYAP